MRTYPRKLYRTRKTHYLDHMLLIAGDIWNWALATKREAYERNGSNISLFEMGKMIKERRNEKGSPWQVVGSQAAENILKRIYLGYEWFFAEIKKGHRASPPRFKHPFKYQSLTFRQSVGYTLLPDNRVRIGNEVFKYHADREIKGTVKTLTIKRNKLGEWFIFIVTDYQEVFQGQPRSGKSVGLDFGLKTFLTGSDGTKIQSPEFFKESSKKIKRLSKIVSSKKKGGGNRERARLDLARAYEDIANKRKDFHWKLALDLVRKYDTIVLETLNIDGMKRLWGRKVSDLAFYSFVQILKQQAEKHGTRIVFIDRWFPSSKTCSSCGWIKEDLNLQDRSWECQGCHTHLDRDLNAAQNIYRVGMTTLAGADVSPSPQALTSEHRGHSALIAQSRSS